MKKFLKKVFFVNNDTNIAIKILSLFFLIVFVQMSLIKIAHRGEKSVRVGSFTSIIDKNNDGKADYVQTAFGTRMGFINYIRPATGNDQKIFDGENK